MKKAFLRLSLLFLAAIFLHVMPAFSQDPEGTLLPYGEHLDDLGDSVFRPFNSVKKLGHLSGMIKSYTIWQGVEAYTGNAIRKDYAGSSTLGFFLDYKTPVFSGFSGKLQYVNVITPYQGQHSRQFPDAYYNQNGDYHLFNELNLNYNFGALGLPKTDIRAGRQIRHLDYFKKIAIRQKEQSMQAAVLTTKDIPDLSLILGHMYKFSSWSGRGVLPFDPAFVNVGDQMMVPYRTSGATFASGTYKGIPKTSITLYDWALWNLVNVLGAKGTYTVAVDDFKVIPGAHFAWERDIGRMEKDGRGKVTSWVLEVTTTFKYQDWFSLQPGYTWVSRNKMGEINNFLQPFDTLFIVDKEKGGPYTRPLNAGSQSFTLSNTIKWKKTKLLMIYYYTYHDKSSVDGTTDRGTRDQQLELFITKGLTKNLSTKLVLVYGRREADRSVRKDRDKGEMRISVIYNF